MRKFLEEFGKFISKGNVVSMAVGIIIGGAFTSIVNNVVTYLITPLIGIVCGGIDFTSFEIKIGEAVFGVGIVFNSIVTFLMTAFVLFLIVRQCNRISEKMEQKLKALTAEEKAEEPEKEPEPSDEVKLLTEIRDLLRKESSAEAAE